MKDKNKLLLDKNPLFSLATVNTEGLSKVEVIAATVIIREESRIIQTIKVQQNAIIVATLNIVKNKTALHKVKHAIYIKKFHFEQICRSKQKLLSPLVISTVEKIISTCNKENNKLKLPTLKIQLKTPESLKYQELEAVPHTGAQIKTCRWKPIH